MQQRVYGFTLLEVLIAIAIFATAGAAILQASASHLRAVQQLEELTLASMLANDLLHNAQLDTNWPPREMQQGEISFGQRAWLWQIRSVVVPDQDLRELQVVIRQPEQPEQVFFQLKTFVGKPSVQG